VTSIRVSPIPTTQRLPCWRLFGSSRVRPRWDAQSCVPALLFAWGIVLTLSACQSPPESQRDLPPIQASSAHFHYHARSPDDVQSDILDRLERNRADFYQFMGLADESITDYYYFADETDLIKNAPCTLPRSDCTLRHSAYASIPFHEHEIIHTYMAGVGAPSAPILEGVAESVGCIRSAGADYNGSELDWRVAVSNYPSADSTLYAGDQRFVTQLMNQMSVAKTVEYYRQDLFTLDPAQFALAFEHFWNLRIDDVWSAAVGSGAPGPFLPICPCAVNSVAIDSTETSVAHPNDADYRPMPLDSGPLTIEFSTNGYIDVQNCRRDTPSMQVLQQSRLGRSTLVLQPDQEQYFLTFENSGTERFTASRNLSLQPTCSGLSTFSAVAGASQLGVAAPRSGGPNWFIGVSAAAPMRVERIDAGTGALTICSDCSLTNCQSLDSLGATASVGGGMVIQFTPDSSTSTRGLDAVVVVFH